MRKEIRKEQESEYLKIKENWEITSGLSVNLQLNDFRLISNDCWLNSHKDCTRGKTESEQKKIKIKVRAKLRDTNISSVTDAWISCYEENIKNSTLRFMVLISGWYNEKYSSIDWSYYLLSTVYLMHSEIFNPRFGICQNLCPRK